MIGASFADEIDCGSFFDHIDDLLDFPTEDLDVGFTTDVDSNSAFPPIWSTQSDSLTASDSVFSGNTNSGLCAELSVPYEDIVQLEWLSNFVEDSFSGGGSLTVVNKQDSIFKNNSSTSSSTLNQFHTSSPISVLDSSSSYSGDKGITNSPEETLTIGRCGRARSKRPRPPTFIPRPGMQLISPTSSEATTHEAAFTPGKVSSDSENYAESRCPSTKEVSSKKKKIKLSFPREMNQKNVLGQGVRKCLHCEVTKTPQWRAGPLGPKTLCNACGVRYKSGRLFPEYRPAASPTFVPCLHSNSHKKVIEMRTKQGEMATNSPDLIPNTNSGICLDYV